MNRFIAFFLFVVFGVNIGVYVHNKMIYEKNVIVDSWTMITSHQFTNNGTTQYKGYNGKIIFNECIGTVNFPEETISPHDVTLYMNTFYEKGTNVKVFKKMFNNTCYIVRPESIGHLWASFFAMGLCSSVIASPHYFEIIIEKN